MGWLRDHVVNSTVRSAAGAVCPGSFPPQSELYGASQRKIHQNVDGGHPCGDRWRISHLIFSIIQSRVLLCFERKICIKNKPGRGDLAP